MKSDVLCYYDQLKHSLSTSPLFYPLEAYNTEAIIVLT